MELNITNVGLLVALASLIVGWLGYNLAKIKQDKQEIKEDTTYKNEIDFCKKEIEDLKSKENQSDPTLEMQLEYIKNGIDDIKQEIKEIKNDAKSQDQKINTLVEKIARLEESEKSAHKRINDFELRLGVIERK